MLQNSIMKANPELALNQNYEGNTPIHEAIISRSMEVLSELEEYKIDSLTIKNVHGENPLFLACKVGDKDIFEWFSGKVDFFNARGDRNYKGQTIEHYVCMLSKHDIVHHIKPLPDTKDYYGNLPIFYSIQNNDKIMIDKYFKKGKQYFHIKNFRNQNLFHVAAKYNSLEALQSITKDNIFLEELIKRDFKGDTPLHTAAKNGSVEVLEYFLSNCTQKFIEIENDFGLTPLEAVREKINLQESKEDDDKVETKSKLHDIKRSEELLEQFDGWMVYEEKGDPDLKLFTSSHRI